MFSKTRRTIIAVSALAAAAAIGFVAAAARMTASTAGDFAGSGYVLSLDASLSEEVIVKNEYRFNSGTEWELERNGRISFRTAEGGSVQVEPGSFVHYENGSAGVLADAAAANLDGYPDGVIDYYNLSPEALLEKSEGRYRYRDAVQEYQVENLLIKSLDGHYLALSPKLLLTLGDGTEEEIGDGYLEIGYADEEKLAVQLTDGVQAWQVLSEGCTVTLANGVVLELAEEEIRVPDASSVSGSRTSVGFEELKIAGGARSQSGRKSGVRELAEPIFQFFLKDGEDGEDGLEGLGGTAGEDGEAGMNGEDGADGSSGTDGGNGTTGATGAGGTAGENAPNGEDSDEIVILGTPKLVIDSWEQSGTGLSFQVAYETLSLEYITREPEAWNVAIYEVGGDGAPVENWTVASDGYGEISLIPSQDEAANGSAEPLSFRTDRLLPDREYRVVIRDTYKLNDNKSEMAAYELAERTFTTDVSGVRMDLVRSSEDSLQLSLKAHGGTIVPGSAVLSFLPSASDPSAGDYLSVTTEIDGDSVTYDWGELTVNSDRSVTVRYYQHQEGGEPLLVKELTLPSSDPDASYEEALEKLTLPHLPSGTEMKVSASVKVQIAGEEKAFEKTLESSYETRKRSPQVGGVTLKTYEGGFLRAQLCGLWDDGQKDYGKPVDEDGVLRSVTWRLYDEIAFKAGCRMEGGKLTGFTPSEKYPAAAVKTVELTEQQTYADFVVDHKNIKSNSWYYAVAEYTYTDGASEWTVPVPESRADLEEGDYRHKEGEPAWARAILDEEKHITMSFNAAGSGIYNNEQDQEEGVTYHSITGLMSVQMSGHKIMVSDIYPMTLTVTGSPCYEQSISYTACNGRQGVCGGDFDLSVRLDGLLEKHAYTFTLNAWLYDASTGEYVLQPVATNVVSTGTPDPVEVAMIRSDQGTGVEFVLGGQDYATAAALPVYQQNTPDYLRKIPASLRNLSEIVFELYPKSSNAGEPAGDPIGVAYARLNEADQASAAEYGMLYDYYYGANISDTKKSGEYENTVGIGDSFQFRFLYTAAGASAVTQNRKNAGDPMEMEDLEEYGYPYNTFQISARAGYDYTSERYVYSKNLTDKQREEGVTEEELLEYKAMELYPYYKDWAQEGLFKSDYTNTLTVRSQACLVNSSNRPTHPLVFQPNLSKPAITLTELHNSYGMQSEETDITTFNLGIDPKLFDPSYDEVASMGFRLTTGYNINYTKTLAYYGFSYDRFYEIDKNTSLDSFKDQALLKFTIGDYGTVNADNTVTCNYMKQVNGADVAVTPEVWLLFYNSGEPDSALTQAVQKAAAAGTLVEKKDGDAGYDYYYQPERDDGKHCYTDQTGKDIFVLYADVSQENRIRRGDAFLFAMDSELHYWDPERSTYDFSYPGRYYEKGWVLDGTTKLSYQKDAALQSNPATALRTRPECEARFLSMEKNADGTLKDTWQIRLKDRDGAVYLESMANEADEERKMTVLGGLLLYDPDQKTASALPTADDALKVDLSEGGTAKSIVIQTGGQNMPETGKVTFEGFQNRKEALEALYQKLASEDGAVVVFENQHPEMGRRYQWALVYNRCDTERLIHVDAGQVQFPLLDHAHLGNAAFEDHFEIITKPIDENTPYGIRMGSDNDTLTVSILEKDGKAFDEQAFQKVGAIAVTAYNPKGYTVNGKTMHWIDRYQLKDGNPQKTGTGHATVWITEFEDIAGADGTVIGKSFTYRISDFRSSVVEAFRQGDELQYFYRVYHTDGTSRSPEDAYQANEGKVNVPNRVEDQGKISYFSLKELSESAWLYPRQEPEGAGIGVVNSFKEASFNYYSMNDGQAHTEQEFYGRGPENLYSARELLNLSVQGQEFPVGGSETVTANGSYTLPAVPRQRPALADFQIRSGLSMASSYVQIINHEGISEDSRLIYLLYERNTGKSPYQYYRLDFTDSTKITPEEIAGGTRPEINSVYLKERGKDYVRCTGLQSFEAGATYYKGVKEIRSYKTEQAPDPDALYYLRKKQEEEISYELADMTEVKDFSFQIYGYRYLGAMLGGDGNLKQDGKDTFQLTGLTPNRSYYLVPWCLDDTMYEETDLNGQFSEQLVASGIIEQGDPLPEANHLFRQDSASDKDMAEKLRELVETSYTRVELDSLMEYEGGRYYTKNGDSWILQEEPFTPQENTDYYVRSFFRFDSNRAVDTSAKSEGTGFTSYNRRGLDTIQNMEYSWTDGRWEGTWKNEELARAFATSEGATANVNLSGYGLFEEEPANLVNHSNLRFTGSAGSIEFEDEHTKLYWFLKRRPLDGSGDWETILGDEHCPAVADGRIWTLLKADQADCYESWSHYGKDQEFCASHEAVSNTPPLHLQFYPGDPRFQPGYEYRLALLVLQEYGDGRYGILNVQESDGSLNCQSKSKEWRAYAGENLLGSGTRLESFTTTSIDYSVRLDNQSGMLADNGYYVRLCRQMEKEDGTLAYETIENQNCYVSAKVSQGSNGDVVKGQSAMNRLYPAGRTVTFHFEIPKDQKSNTNTYRLQYYAYVDKDFNRIHEVAGDQDAEGNLILAGDLDAAEPEQALPDFEFEVYTEAAPGAVGTLYEKKEAEYRKSQQLTFGDVILPGVYYEDVYEKADGRPEDGTPCYIRSWVQTKDTWALPGKTYYDENGTEKKVPEVEDGGRYEFASDPDNKFYVPSYSEAPEQDQTGPFYIQSRELINREGELASEDTIYYVRIPEQYTALTGQPEEGKIYYTKKDYYPPVEGDQVISNLMKPHGGYVSDNLIYEEKLAQEKGYLEPGKISSYSMNLSKAAELLIGFSEDISLPEKETFTPGTLTSQMVNEDGSLTLHFSGAYGLEQADYLNWSVTYNGQNTPPVRVERKEDGTVMDNNGYQGSVSLTIHPSGLSWQKGQKYSVTLQFLKKTEAGPEELIDSATFEFEI